MTEDAAKIYYTYLRKEKLEKAKRKKPTAKKKRTMKLNRELAAKKARMWEEEWSPTGPKCGLCGLRIDYETECDIGHESSRGMGGGKRDDTKVFLCHHLGNVAQGSQSRVAYLSGKTKEQLRKLCGIA